MHAQDFTVQTFLFGTPVAKNKDIATLCHLQARFIHNLSKVFCHPLDYL